MRTSSCPGSCFLSLPQSALLGLLSPFNIVSDRIIRRPLGMTCQSSSRLTQAPGGCRSLTDSPIPARRVHRASPWVSRHAGHCRSCELPRGFPRTNPDGSGTGFTMLLIRDDRPRTIQIPGRHRQQSRAMTSDPEGCSVMDLNPPERYHCRNLVRGLVINTPNPKFGLPR